MNTDLDTVVEQQRERISSLLLEIAELKALVAGDLAGHAARLQARADRQRAALDVLNVRVRSQRFYLRLVNELGRGLSREEYTAARDAAESRDRLLESV